MKQSQCDDQKDYNITYIEFVHSVSEMYNLSLIVIKHQRNLD